MVMLAFEDHYETSTWPDHSPVMAADAETAQEYLVPEYGIERVWTIMGRAQREHDEDRERFTYYARHGVHVTGALYYVVSTEPVRAEHADTDFTY